jgi:hypothetical protein
MKRGTLTHSSGGKKITIKFSGGTYRMRIQDGTNVIDIPLSESEAEAISNFLSGKTPKVKVSDLLNGKTPPLQPVSTGTNTDKNADCKTCGGSGDVPGLFAGMRSPCPDCKKSP